MMLSEAPRAGQWEELRGDWFPVGRDMGPKDSAPTLPISSSAPQLVFQTPWSPWQVQAGSTPDPSRLGAHLPGPSMAEGGTGRVSGAGAFTASWQRAAPASWRVSQAVRSCLSVGGQPAR